MFRYKQNSFTLNHLGQLTSFSNH